MMQTLTLSIQLQVFDSDLYMNRRLLFGNLLAFSLVLEILLAFNLFGLTGPQVADHPN